MCVLHVRERQSSELQLAEFPRTTPDLGMGLSSTTPPRLLDKKNEPCSALSVVRSKCPSLGALRSYREGPLTSAFLLSMEWQLRTATFSLLKQ